MQRLTQVITWKGRNDPDDRVIPAFLKLAILSRGTLQIPTDKIKPFLDIARANGATWPDRLVAPISDVAKDLPVTFELFQNRRPTLTPDEITKAIEGYLVLRRKKDLSRLCWTLIYSWLPARDRPALERTFDVDVGELFRRPRVTIRQSDDPSHYVLVYYLCLPSALKRLVAPAWKPNTPSPLPPRPTGKPPLKGFLSNVTELNFRVGPSTAANSLGVQAGTAAAITVNDKQKTGDDVWYQITLEDNALVVPNVGAPLSWATSLPKGTTAWVTKGAIDAMAVSWPLLRNDLADFDATNSSMSLGERVTALRQHLHTKKLPFDQVIGTDPGKVYIDDIPFDSSRWQMGRDYKIFIAPDGRWVDLLHVACGMDVLARPEADATYMNIPVGSNYGAATWSGDAGSAAAEATLRFNQTTWERWNPAATKPARLQHYFDTRVSEKDRLGDLDGWGIHLIQQQNQKFQQIDDLFSSYYEDTAAEVPRTLTVSRRLALQQFLSHYGFTYDAASDGPRYPVFPSQNRPAGRFVREIELFAGVWMLYRNKNLAAADPQDNARRPQFVGEMAVQLLYWLEQQTIENAVEVK